MERNGYDCFEGEKTPCPFKDCNHDDKHAEKYTIYNLTTSMKFTDNFIHMISHGIFGDVCCGKIHLELLLEIINLKSGIDTTKHVASNEKHVAIDFSPKKGPICKYLEYGFALAKINDGEFNNCENNFKTVLCPKDDRAHVYMYDMNSNIKKKSEFNYNCDYKIFITDCEYIPNTNISFMFEQHKIVLRCATQQIDITVNECQTYVL